MSSPSVNKDEVEKFSKLANEWWDVNGPFKILHEINPIRLEYICEKLGYDLSNLKILDLSIISMNQMMTMYLVAVKC